MSNAHIDCRDCIFSYRWKDWGPKDVANDIARRGWVGACLIQPSAAGRPKEVRGGRPVCDRFIKHDWPKYIMHFARGVGQGQLVAREEIESRQVRSQEVGAGRAKTLAS